MLSAEATLSCIIEDLGVGEVVSSPAKLAPVQE
jgi:hypothetical protein